MIKKNNVACLRGVTMEDVKQFIVVRNDLNMRRGEIASQVAAASVKFLIENNEAARPDQVFVNLSNDEVSWLTGSFSQIILGVDSEEQLHDILNRAEFMGIEAHSNTKGNELVCVALGPDNTKIIEKIVSKLKPI
jgi:peptidyl-tRNA hydrolase